MSYPASVLVRAEETPHDEAESLKALLSSKLPDHSYHEDASEDQLDNPPQGKRHILAFFAVQAAVFVGSFTSYATFASHPEGLQQESDKLSRELQFALSENDQLKERARQALSPEPGGHPYEAITASEGRQLPELCGSVQEKTIWAYWYNSESCPSSSSCTLPAHIQLCVESIEKNKGSFDFRLIHRDEVGRYVSWYELPFRWDSLEPAQQKDSLMNALLARYGGVAMDISTILLRRIDEYWDEMVENRAAYFGYMYRLNGLPWRHAEVTAVWFMMARREGIFATAARNQVIGMGDRKDTGAYHHWYLALGDQTITSILSNLNYSLPKCFSDETVSDTGKCPEYEQPSWHEGIVGAQRNDMRVVLRDPRDGPQLPFAWKQMLVWHVSNDTEGLDLSDNERGSPLYGTTCTSMAACWRDVFLPRFEGGHLHFVKMFDHGRELDDMSREEILQDTDSFFYNWLSLARVV